MLFATRKKKVSADVVVKRRAKPPRVVIAVSVIAAIVAMAGWPGDAGAGPQAPTVQNYTGCLTVMGGVMTKIAAGDQPLTKCGPGEVVAHFSGGDITAITAGAGLTGGGTNGEVTLSLDPAYTLPQGCGTGQVAKWNGTGWTCAADNDTDTTYAAGTGLALNGTTFSVAPGYQLPQGCAGGQVPVRLSAGTWGCGNRALADQGCPQAQFANGFDASGNLECATPPAPAQSGLPAARFVGLSGTEITSPKVVGTTNVPAGSYLATVSLQSTGLRAQCGGFLEPFCTAGGFTLQCTLANNGNLMGFQAVRFGPDEEDIVTLSINGGALVGPAGATISVSCEAIDMAPVAVIGQMAILQLGGFF